MISGWAWDRGDLHRGQAWDRGRSHVLPQLLAAREGPFLSSCVQIPFVPLGYFADSLVLDRQLGVGRPEERKRTGLCGIVPLP